MNKKEIWIVCRSGPDNDREVTHVCSTYELAAKRARGLTLLWGPTNDWIQDGNRYFSKCLEYHVEFESRYLDAGLEEEELGP